MWRAQLAGLKAAVPAPQPGSAVKLEWLVAQAWAQTCTAFPARDRAARVAARLAHAKLASMSPADVLLVVERVQQFSFSMRFQSSRACDMNPSSATTRRLDVCVDMGSGDLVTHRWPVPEPLLSHHPLPNGGEERAGQWARSTGVRATGRRPIGEAARRRGRRRARRQVHASKMGSRKVGSVGR